LELFKLEGELAFSEAPSYRQLTNSDFTDSLIGFAVEPVLTWVS
jgi:hypothetical protein